jgi:hypothetical protein
LGVNSLPAFRQNFPWKTYPSPKGYCWSHATVPAKPRQLGPTGGTLCQGAAPLGNGFLPAIKTLSLAWNKGLFSSFSKTWPKTRFERPHYIILHIIYIYIIIIIYIYLDFVDGVRGFPISHGPVLGATTWTSSQSKVI